MEPNLRRLTWQQGYNEAMYRPVRICVVFLQVFTSDQIFAAGANISSETLDKVGKSTNKTSSPEYCAITEGPSQLTTTIHVLTLLASLVGNTLLITAFVRMRESILVFVANMAASDLLVAVFLIPRLITREIIGSNAFLVHGNGGTFLCKMCTFFTDISLSVSTQSLVLIAVERFLTIWCPILYRKLTVKMRRALVVSSWIMAMALHSPYFYTFRLVVANPKNPDYQECQSRWDPAFDHKKAHLRYFIFLYLAVLLIPLLVISVLYTAIIIALRRDKMAPYRSTKGAKRCEERNRNLQMMAIATVIAFLICWALFIVISFIKLFSPKTVPKCNNSFKVLDYVSRVLASSYCAVNPCICFIFVRSFSRELKSMCKGKRRRSLTIRKVQGESGSCNSCQTVTPVSYSESTQATVLPIRNKNYESNVLTPCLGRKRDTHSLDNATLYR